MLQINSQILERVQLVNQNCKVWNCYVSDSQMGGNNQTFPTCDKQFSQPAMEIIISRGLEDIKYYVSSKSELNILSKSNFDII